MQVGAESEGGAKRPFEAAMTGWSIWSLMESRTHLPQELLKRYNPLHDMTEEERVHATARRVGLDTPIEFKNE